MRLTLPTLALVIALVAPGCATLNEVGGTLLPPSPPVPYERVGQELRVWSGTFQYGSRIPDGSVFNGFGCTGGNHSPQLAWADAPANTKSFAIIAHDPDAPTGLGFVHWVVFNIPTTTTSLPEGVTAEAGLPSGAVQGFTDFGGPGYGGPCPPAGHPDHRYEFTVYALDVEHLDGGPTTSAALLRFLMRGHVLAQGTIVGKYSH